MKLFCAECTHVILFESVVSDENDTIEIDYVESDYASVSFHVVINPWCDLVALIFLKILHNIFVN